jgi:hypothetical protein
MSPSVKARGWGVETPSCQLGHDFVGAGWHARMSSRLAGKGACACRKTSFQHPASAAAPRGHRRGEGSSRSSPREKERCDAVHVNSLLEEAGISPLTVRPLRHQTALPDGRTPVDLLRGSREAFDIYQSAQTHTSGAYFLAPFWATLLSNRSCERTQAAVIPYCGRSQRRMTARMGDSSLKGGSPK